jgi:plasmid stabilization system protein ParE
LSLTAVFRPAAAADVEEAFHWYEERRPGLGEEFLFEVRRLVQLISAHPQRFPILHRQTRRTLLRRFPYGVFYRVSGDRMLIIACFHAKRSPFIWKSRK